MAKNIVRWKHEHRWPGQPLDTVVWVDVAALDAAWRLDKGYYLEAGAPTSRDRYIKFDQWFSATRKWVGYSSVDLAGDGVGFTDGRHRFAWMRDHGVTALPIACEPNEADEMQRRFGTDLRSSVIVISATLVAFTP